MIEDSVFQLASNSCDQCFKTFLSFNAYLTNSNLLFPIKFLPFDYLTYLPIKYSHLFNLSEFWKERILIYWQIMVILLFTCYKNLPCSSFLFFYRSSLLSTMATSQHVLPYFKILVVQLLKFLADYLFRSVIYSFFITAFWNLQKFYFDEAYFPQN